MALRIPLSWLQDYVDLEQDPVKLAEALTISGMEVESIEHLGDNWGEFCRVGQVKKVVAHPNADCPVSYTHLTLPTILLV